MLIVMQKTIHILIVVVAVLTTSSCKTSISHGFGANRIYSGTRMTFEMYVYPIKTDRPTPMGDWIGLTVVNVVDLPLCFVADTIILPITLPCSIFGDTGEFRNMCRSEPKDSWNPKYHRKVTQNKEVHNNQIQDIGTNAPNPDL